MLAFIAFQQLAFWPSQFHSTFFSNLLTFSLSLFTWARRGQLWVSDSPACQRPGRIDGSPGRELGNPTVLGFLQRRLVLCR